MYSYILKGESSLKYPMFALVQTQICGDLTTSWLWLVIVKEFIVIMTPSGEGLRVMLCENCPLSNLPTLPHSFFPPSPFDLCLGERFWFSEMYSRFNSISLSLLFHIQRTYSFSFSFLNFRAFSIKSEYKMESFPIHHSQLYVCSEKNQIKVEAGSECITVMFKSLKR